MRVTAILFIPLLLVSCIQLPAQPAPSSGQPVPPPPPANMSGAWNSNIGQKYNVSQNGNNFTWQVAGSNEVGKGTIYGNDVTVSWQGANGSGNAKGKVTAIAPNGVATAIAWDNGVAFFR